MQLFVSVIVVLVLLLLMANVVLVVTVAFALGDVSYSYMESILLYKEEGEEHLFPTSV